jgi:hypothetical protein
LAIVFLRRERLAGDDEERLFGREAGERRREVVAVDVGDEVECEARRREVRERAHRHPRSEVAAADADVDDVAKRRRAGGGRVGAPPHGFGEVEHRVEHGVDLVAEEARAAWRAQRGSGGRRALRSVLIALPASIASRLRLEPAFVREVDEKAQRRPRRAGSSRGRRRPRARRTRATRSAARRARTPRAGRSRGRAPASGRRAPPRRWCGRIASREAAPAGMGSRSSWPHHAASRNLYFSTT